MAPRTKLCKNRAPSTKERVERSKISGWERSKISAQDNRLLKKMGLFNKKAMKMPGDESSPHPPSGFSVTFVDFLIRGFSIPVHEFLRGLLFIYGIQLHQLTPNSLLLISIFVTLCECFLGIHPRWGLWKRIFYLRRNNSKNTIYNVGGVCICVRPEVGYFDVKFADSVQGWRKKWLYVKDESSTAQEYGLAPFDASEDIQRRKSWDAEATAEEKAAIDALIARIQELQNTKGAELSGVQIIAHFLRIRVQPLQSRKNPLWLYSGAEDADRVSDDLPLKDLEKLVRRFTSLSKNNEVHSSCRVEPFNGDHAPPDNHLSLSSLPPLPEGGDVDERAVVNDDSQESSVPESEPAESQKSAGSSDKDSESEQPSDSAHSVSPPPAASPDKRKRKRNADEDSSASKLSEPVAEGSSSEEHEVFDLYTATGAVSSDDEEDLEPETHGPANTSTSNTLVLSEDRRVTPETLPPAHDDPEASSLAPSPRAPKKKRARTGAAGKQELAAKSISTPLLDDPLMKEMVDLGSRFIGFRDEAESLREALRRAKERANDLEEKLRASEEAREKAEKDAAGVEDLRRRLQAAEDALSDKEAKLVQRDNDIITRLETQSRRFSTGKMGEHYTLNQESDEYRVMDTLTILELNCDLARECLTSARNALRRIFPHFFPKIMQPEIFAQLAQQFLAKDDPASAYRQTSLKIGVEGTIALVAASGQKVDWVKAAAAKGLNTEKWKALVKDTKLYSKKLIAFLDPKSLASASTAQTELIFDNYTGAGPSDTSPAISHSTKVPGGASLDISSCPGSIEQEIADLRQQLQSMKKQTVTILEQSRKSSDREQTALRQAQEALELKETATSNAARSAQRESYMLDLMTDASQDMAGAFLDTSAEEQRVNSRVETLLRLAKANDIDFWADESRCRRIVQFQDRAAQTREFLDFCNSTFAMVYNAMFPQNPQPENLTELMDNFKDVRNIHDFVKAQMVAGAKFALIWLKICHSKLDLDKVVESLLLKMSKRKVNIDKNNAAVSPVAEKMIDELLKVDTTFFKEYRYDDSTQNIRAARENIDRWI
ncbi:hypothetical protein ACQ4PT_025098 [Festuca glaucescens]